jgi:acyl-CoA synthetase (AMP-forming)/AMP-acid ligase II/thioesterase domain-containing protein/aryl carrier-like protein
MTNRNLSSLLYRAASAAPERGITWYGLEDDNTPHQVTYSTLLERASEISSKIRAIKDIENDSVVLLHFDDTFESITWFWSTVLAGYLPALSPPFSLDERQHEKHMNHLYEMLNCPVVITSSKFISRFPGPIGAAVYETNDILSLQSTKEGVGISAPSKRGNDTAVLMLTSGSTSHAKAVSLRNNQIFSAIEGKADCHKTTADDVFLNWINLDHVANLIESHLHALYLSANQVHVNGSRLLARPIEYLEIINRHRVSFSFAPNFFLSSLSRAMEERVNWKDGAPDLSCVRTITSGGEALVVETCQTLVSRLGQYGCSRTVLVPGFGMTETCAGVIHNTSFPVYDSTNGFEFASLGTCHTGLSMRVVNEEGTVCPPNIVGHLQLSGPSVFTEYFNNRSATIAAFTDGCWFITGDMAAIDSVGMLRLVGRSKDVVNINGIKYPFVSLTTALEDARILGMTPSYTVVFDYRPPNQQTESLVVLYLPAYRAGDSKSRAETDDDIARTMLLNCGARPYAIIPLDTTLLQKTSLGKLPAARLRTAFERGRFNAALELHKSAIAEYKASQCEVEPPMSETELLIQRAMADILDIDPSELGIGDGLFDQGLSSMHLIRLKKELQDMFGITEIPIVILLTNGSIRSLAQALHSNPGKDSTFKLNSSSMSSTSTWSPGSYSPSRSVEGYMPVVALRRDGPGTPLWLVHPGAGEILVYLQLASFFADRPVYALRARGFDGEPFFETLDECISTYVAHIKRVQPYGPYAVVGYSFGGMFAFEISKRLNALSRDEGLPGVRFLGVLNLPPHVKQRIRQLNMITAVLTLALFLGLVTEDDPETFDSNISRMDHKAVLNEVLRRAPRDRMRELDIDRAKLLRWAEVSNALHALAWDYEPNGTVDVMDVFCAIPLKAVANNRYEWKEMQLRRWTDFVGEGGVEFHDVRGEHFNMIGSNHVESFQSIMKETMKARGV